MISGILFSGRRPALLPGVDPDERSRRRRPPALPGAGRATVRPAGQDLRGRHPETGQRPATGFLIVDGAGYRLDIPDTSQTSTVEATTVETRSTHVGQILIRQIQKPEQYQSESRKSLLLELFTRYVATASALTEPTLKSKTGKNPFIVAFKTRLLDRLAGIKNHTQINEVKTMVDTVSKAIKEASEPDFTSEVAKVKLAQLKDDVESFAKPVDESPKNPDSDPDSADVSVLVGANV